MQNLTRNTPRPSLWRKTVMLTLFTAALLTGLKADAQTYTSNFASSTGNYTVTNPTGGLCLSPAFETPQNIADADLTNYARISGLIATQLLCTNPNYVLRTKLNLPQGVTQVPTGATAGFRVSFSSVANVSLLQNNITIRTYLAGALAQTIPGTSIASISLLTNNTAGNLSFASTAPFDEIELVINNGIIPLGLAVDNRFYNAFATIGTLPVKFGTVAAKIQSGSLNVEWTTVSETNNEKFVIEASKDGRTWASVGTMDTKAANGQSSVQLAYNFSTPWGTTALAGFGLLGLLLLPAVRSRLLRVAMLFLVVTAMISCAKESNDPGNLLGGSSSSQNVYVRVAQIDKNGASTYSEVVIAKR